MKTKIQTKASFIKVTSMVMIMMLFILPSCVDDLNIDPFNEVTSAQIYDDPNNYLNVLAKCYAGYSVTGQSGPAGNSDLPASIDEGFSQYIRVLFKLQEVPTDELIIRWNDQGLPELNKWTWNSGNVWMRGGYLRMLYQITICNELIKQSAPDALDERGFSSADKSRIAGYRAEARFLRALSLYHATDLFGRIPDILDENEFPGTAIPEQLTVREAFDFIESELKEIESELPVQNEYARANRGAAQTLLAKLYLNAEALIGEARYADALTYSERVIGSGVYSLDNKYTDLFRADNHTSPEVIFPITHDGTRTTSYGGTTFLINASGFPTSGRFLGTDSATYTAVGSAFPSTRIIDSTGSSESWQGLLATPELLNKFPDSTLDSRFQFVTFQRNPVISRVPNSPPAEGFICKKWRNVTSDGTKGVNNQFADTDFPLFRLADVYLMYAEAHLRGGGGSLGQALQYVNAIRERAYGNASRNFTSITLQDILDERGRELYWEGHRRTDLIRFNQFYQSTYLWTWKGDVQAGAGGQAYQRWYPIPATELTANPNLVQNSGY